MPNLFPDGFSSPNIVTSLDSSFGEVQIVVFESNGKPWLGSIEGYTWDGQSLGEYRNYVYYQQVGDGLVRSLAFDEQAVPNDAVGIEKSIHITLTGINLRGFSQWVGNFDGFRVDIVATSAGKKFAVSGIPISRGMGLEVGQSQLEALIAGLGINDWYESEYNEPFPELVRFQDTWEG